MVSVVLSYFVKRLFTFVMSIYQNMYYFVNEKGFSLYIYSSIHCSCTAQKKISSMKSKKRY